MFSMVEFQNGSHAYCALIPDGYFEIVQHDNMHPMFLEVDLGHRNIGGLASQGESTTSGLRSRESSNVFSSRSVFEFLSFFLRKNVSPPFAER